MGAAAMTWVITFLRRICTQSTATRRMSVAGRRDR
jgi:hypothetical protein